MTILVLALFIDGFQAAITLGFFALGAGVGLPFAWVPVVGQIIETATINGGIFVGIAINICISFTMGAGLITLLFFNNMLHFRSLKSGSLKTFLPIVGDIIPGLSALPCWSAMVVVAMIQKEREKKIIDTMSPSQNLLETESDVEEKSREIEPEIQVTPRTRRFSDIMAPQEQPQETTNENTPRTSRTPLPHQKYAA